MLRIFQQKFSNEYCDADAIQPLCAFENRIVERLAGVNEKILSERYQRNPRIIKFINKSRTIGKELVGFFILYPITGECEKLIEDGVILKSSQIENRHISESAIQANSLYLSMVFGKDKITQAYLIYLLYKDLKKIVRENRAIRSLFVRPVTDAGLRVVQRHAFHKFRENSGIFRRLVSAEDIS